MKIPRIEKKQAAKPIKVYPRTEKTFTVTGKCLNKRHLYISVMMLHGFDYHARIQTTTKYVITGGDHATGSKMSEHYNFREGRGRQRIDIVNDDS